MKQRFSIIYILLLASFLMAAVYMIVTPNISIIDLNIKDEASGYFSKVEHLIFTLFPFVSAAIFSLLIYIRRKRGLIKDSKVFAYTMIFLLLLILLMEAYLMIKAIN